MQVAEGLDTGAVHACVHVPIGARETAAELRRKLVSAGTSLLVSQLRDGLGSPTPQVGESSYAAKITPEELRLDWARPALELDRLVRVGGRDDVRIPASGLAAISSTSADPTVLSPRSAADCLRHWLRAPGCPRRVSRDRTRRAPIA